jgi:hypothetical protein
MALEKLDGAFVLLGCRTAAERPEISAATRLQILLARVQPVLT